MKTIIAVLLATIPSHAAFSTLEKLRHCNTHLNSEPLSESTINSDDSPRIFCNRRAFLTASCAAAVLPCCPSSATATMGAAEYDAGYYLRDIVFGNKPEGNLPASDAPALPPPRTLQGPLLSLLLDDQLQSCIAVEELAAISRAPVKEISSRVQEFRSKCEPAFSSRYQWKERRVSDEYFFDCTTYSLWKVAAFYIPQDYVKRDFFVRNVGRRILNEMIEKEILSNESIKTLEKGKRSSLTETIPCINEVLNIFQSANFCSSFRLGDKNDDVRSGAQIFDELDNQEILDGGQVNVLVSVLNPSTLGGSLQITGEGSRFSPDFVGPLLAAVWEKIVNGGENIRIEVEWESYFVDPVYRPNPKDFFPDEQLYQFTISSRRHT
jgi:hypothetical protein